MNAATKTTVTFVSAKPRKSGALALTFSVDGHKVTTLFSAKRTQRGGVVGFDFDIIATDPNPTKVGTWRCWGSRQHTAEYAAGCEVYCTVNIDAVRAEVLGA